MKKQYIEAFIFMVAVVIGFVMTVHFDIELDIAILAGLGTLGPAWLSFRKVTAPTVLESSSEEA